MTPLKANLAVIYDWRPDLGGIGVGRWQAIHTVEILDQWSASGEDRIIAAVKERDLNPGRYLVAYMHSGMQRIAEVEVELTPPPVPPKQIKVVSRDR